jgi:hypothetical protein
MIFQELDLTKPFRRSVWDDGVIILETLCPPNYHEKEDFKNGIFLKDIRLKNDPKVAMRIYTVLTDEELNANDWEQ